MNLLNGGVGMAKKSGLGGGINNLFNTASMEKFNATLSEHAQQIYEIDVSMIVPNPNQPRKVFDQEKIETLASSIKQFGLIVPILVSKEGDQFHLIAGERRLRATKLLGKKKINAIIENADEKKSSQVALIENIQREDLNPVEEAEAYLYLSNTFDLTQEEISDIAGKSRVHVANMLRLLHSGPEVLNALSEGKITSGHARALLMIKNDKNRGLGLQYVINKGLSVRETERYAKDFGKPVSKPKKVPSKRSKVLEIELIEAQEKLIEMFSTKVTIKKNGGKGAVVIDFYNEEELARILEQLFHVKQ